MKISSRGMCCPPSNACGIGAFRCYLMRELSLFHKDSISCDKVYIFKTLVFYIYILDYMCGNLFLGTHTMSVRFLS
jgi:hypothetical protein